ncbi:metal-dependent transcriptional regulator [Granulicella arctica]|uniref:Transcriptional regulator MntR n=1 Tax=Granulicella arctica TaxID=940613 RepID=A0A7Y9THS5_9BACT|nr:metal-dependent transcriptional regulator [Granulicella arctica]NYF80874.1 DtxR family Mn-dependent transcriptional regulator [Granulicella arctica]
MPEAITISKEDYLKAILEAESEGHTVIPTFLAHWLEVSPPAVTKAVKKLKQDGYIDGKADGGLRLTAKGKEAAYRTALRHHLIERMLSEVFGMEWHQIHAEAERLEHAVSPIFEAKLIEKLGAQGLCPHGNEVLPEAPAQRKRRGLLPLIEAVEHTDYVVASLYERDPKLLEFLHRLGIGPRAPIKVLERNYDDTWRIQTPNGPATIGKSAAERVWIQPKSSNERRKK